MTRAYRAAHLLLSDGWASPGFFSVADDGTIESAGHDELVEIDERLDGYVVPGIPNVHSHAHQRGLVGWADQLTPGAHETLWRWRQRMYDHVLGLTPENLEALAAQAYVEMLKTGFTTVGEFHYVHQDLDGRPYANPTEMSERICTAAERTGIALTIIPALYSQGGVNRPPEPCQRRFVTTVEHYLGLLERLRSLAATRPRLEVAAAAHSLRAVAPAEIAELLAALPAGPRHIHVSERIEEVQEIHAALGARPVEWLLKEIGLDERWTLIHATHIDQREREGIAHAGVIVGLCPLTEANLGDGLFPLAEYSRLGGRWTVGSDANHLIDATGELRILEYGQRLRHHRRDNVIADGHVSVARVLLERSLAGGAQALAQPIGVIRPGLRADLIELDPDHPTLVGQTKDTVLDAWIFSSSTEAPVRNVMVGGKWMIRDRHHAAEEEILRDFRITMRECHSA